MIWYIVSGIIFIIFYKLIGSVLIQLIKMKIRLGAKAMIKFYPLQGDFFNFQKSFNLYRDGLEFFKRRAQANPQVKFILTNVLHKPAIEFYDPEYYKELLINHENYEKFNFLGHEGLSSKGIVFSSGAKWKQQRHILGIPFFFEKLKARLPMINNATKRALANNNQEHILEFLSSITSDVVVKSFFGDDCSELKVNGRSLSDELMSLTTEMGKIQISNPYVFLKHILLGQRAWTFLPLKRETEIDQRIKSLRSFVTQIIEDKIKNYKPSSGDKNFLDTYIDSYLNQKEQDPLLEITIDELVQQFISLFSAGTDTTSNVTANCLYFLGKDQQAQNEIRDEINQILQDSTDLAENQLNKLIKLSAFINEVLRMKNPVFAILMRIAKQSHYVKDLFIEKGTFLFIFYSIPLWQEEYFDNPNEFNYKRWLSKNPIKNDNGFVFLPFSAGGRNCIGQHMALMEIKTILVQIIKNYNITRKEDVEVTWPVNLFWQMSPDTGIKLSKI